MIRAPQTLIIVNNHMSENWEVLAQRKYTDKLVFSILTFGRKYRNHGISPTVGALPILWNVSHVTSGVRVTETKCD